MIAVINIIAAIMLKDCCYHAERLLLKNWQRSPQPCNRE
uniref:Uncharacterized protein n=1 Tax=Raoultella ornithinolytica TaxID=54291 RepID=A0A4D6FVY5_RAOOR|nr:hypothetical protein [Raoultella ornithinolytica]UUW41767.1 hypothetical protein [Klebsiella michiganensis]